jgi:hypothetical protein
MFYVNSRKNLKTQNYENYSDGPVILKTRIWRKNLEEVNKITLQFRDP